MAQFIYKGEPSRPWVKTYGPTLELKVPKSDGTWTVLRNPDGFKPGDLLPFDFEDARSIRVLQTDPRFEEVVRG